MIKEEIAEVARKIKEIENIFETNTTKSWNKYRSKITGVWNAFSFEELKNQKNQLHDKEILLLNLLVEEKKSRTGK